MFCLVPGMPFPFSGSQEDALETPSPNFNQNSFALTCFIHGDRIHSQLGTVWLSKSLASGPLGWALPSALLCSLSVCRGGDLLAVLPSPVRRLLGW